MSESDTSIARRNLKVVDVAALILNKMVRDVMSGRRFRAEVPKVGTGIFTTPGAVLLATGSVHLSIGLWIVGGVYSLVWYVEYY